MSQEITNLGQLLDRIDKTLDEHQEVTLGMIVEAVGGRSFGPLLLVAGLVMVSPLSGFPGMPTCTGIVALLISAQLLFGSEHFWLPRWMLRRSIERSKIRRALRHLRSPARVVDRALRPRLPGFIDGWGRRGIALACTVIAVSMPAMEVVPFSAHAAGLALSAFGLALIAGDGLVALIAFLVTGCTFGVVLYHLLT